MRKLTFGAAAPLFLALAASAQTPAAKPASPPPLPTPGSAGKPNQPPPPAHPITLEQAHELMQLMGTDKIKTRMMDNVTAYEQRFPPYVPQDVKDDVHASFEKMDIDGQTIATYQRYLSTEDAAKIIDFDKTPAGKNLLAVTPMMMGEIQQNANKMASQTMQAAIERHKPEIEAAQKSYEAAHPTPTLGSPSTGSGTGSSAGKSTGTGGTSTGTSSGSSSAPKKPQ